MIPSWPNASYHQSHSGRSMTARIVRITFSRMKEPRYTRFSPEFCFSSSSVKRACSGTSRSGMHSKGKCTSTSRSRHQERTTNLDITTKQTSCTIWHGGWFVFLTNPSPCTSSSIEQTDAGISSIMTTAMPWNKVSRIWLLLPDVDWRFLLSSMESAGTTKQKNNPSCSRPYISAI